MGLIRQKADMRIYWAQPRIWYTAVFENDDQPPKKTILYKGNIMINCRISRCLNFVRHAGPYVFDPSPENSQGENCRQSYFPSGFLVMAFMWFSQVYARALNSVKLIFWGSWIHLDDSFPCSPQPWRFSMLIPHMPNPCAGLAFFSYVQNNKP